MVRLKCVLEWWFFDRCKRERTHSSTWCTCASVHRSLFCWVWHKSWTFERGKILPSDDKVFFFSYQRKQKEIFLLFVCVCVRVCMCGCVCACVCVCVCVLAHMELRYSLNLRHHCDSNLLRLFVCLFVNLSVLFHSNVCEYTIHLK